MRAKARLRLARGLIACSLSLAPGLRPGGLFILLACPQDHDLVLPNFTPHQPKAERPVNETGE
jgi:hypothetical protein